VAGALIGVVFGLMLCWSGMSSPVVIREALLLQDSYLFLMFASAVATATAGLWVLRQRERRALLADTPIGWTRERPARAHVLGSLMFGIGWGVADACPGPIATQVGQGVPWALCTLAGAATGIYVFLRRGRAETEPAVEHAAPAAPVTVAG
jgi:uncharacterized membrane protein YedE/YeeE